MNRKVRPPTLSRSTHHAARSAGRRGRCAGGGRCAGRRGPRRRARSRRRRARWSCPDPVSPVSRNSPPAASSSKSTCTVSTNGPKAVIESSCSRISRTPRRHARRRGRGPRSSTRAPRAAGRTRRRSPASPRTWRDEVERHVVRRPAGRGTARAGVGLAAARREPQGQGVREAGAQPLHGLDGPDVVGERRLHPGVLVRARSAVVGEQLVERALEPGERTGDRGRRRSVASREAVGAEVDQPGALDVVGLGEGVGDRRPAVAHGLAQGRAAVQVAEGGVVDAVEELERARRRRRPRRCRARSRWAARRRRTRAPAPPSGCRRAGRRGRPGPGSIAVGRGRRWCERVGSSHARGEHVGLEVGDAVDRDRAVLVVEQHRLVDAAGVGAQVHAGEVDETRVEAEARGRSRGCREVITTRAREVPSRWSASSASATASTEGSARS